MSRFMTALALSAALIAGPALAQTPAAPAKSEAKPAAADVKKEADKAPAKLRTVKAMLSGDVIKASVYDPKEARIGEIDSLLLSPQGNVTHALIGVGGFLGMGEKTVAVPFSDLKLMSRDSKTWFELNRTKDQLKAAETFDAKPYKF